MKILMIIVIGDSSVINLREWIKIIRNHSSNYHFFLLINAGWLELEYKFFCGNNPTELQQWQWMVRNAETIYVHDKIYNKLIDCQ